jgi:signal transduction histidine kinase
MAKLTPRLGLWVQTLCRLVRAGTTVRWQATEQLLAHHTQLQALVSELALAEERERRRIATGLHDDVGQCLAVAQILLSECLASAPGAGSQVTVSVPLACCRRPAYHSPEQEEESR